jgi:hypothetical protein
MIQVDQGTEFVSRDLDLWAYQRGVTLVRVLAYTLQRNEERPHSTTMSDLTAQSQFLILETS